MRFPILAATALFAHGVTGQAEIAKPHDHGHERTEAEKQIYKGNFDDAQSQPRTLADWQGDWQSANPLLLDGALDPVMAKKAVGGDRTAAEYQACHEIGCKTDVNHIVIEGDSLASTARPRQ